MTQTFTLDTNIVTYLLKGIKSIDALLKAELRKGNTIVINPITYYEVCRGLISINAESKLQTFKEMCELFGIIKLTTEDLDIASNIYSILKTSGQLVEDADILIASMCIRNKITLVTNNQKHFSRIEGLNAVNWI